MTGPRTQVVRYGGHPSQFAEVWTPDSVSIHGAVLLLHGGWWRSRHDLHLMDALASDLCDQGHLVWNLEYRRIDGDGGGWPESLLDVMNAVQDLCAGPVTVDPASVVAVGHSAGGHLALHAAKAAGLGGVVALAPITDLARSEQEGLGEGATAVFLDETDTTLPIYDEASPLHQLPIGKPQLIVHGTEDWRVPVAHSRDYATKAVSAGDDVQLVEVQGGDHMFVLEPDHAYWAQAREWLKTVTPRPTSAFVTTRTLS